MIEFIDNQTISFKPVSEIDSDCGCKGQPYCQPVRFTDETQFQIKGNIVNSDPSFKDEYIGWETWESLELSYTSDNITAEGACDGTAELTASLGSGTGYTYSFAGGPFSATNSFTGLCKGTYLALAKDSDGHYASVYVVIEYFDCSTLGDMANDIIALSASEIKNCFANDLT